ncbi:MAG: DUF5591 domain-containing protein [Methanobacteriota archaeon]|nr:MAG: DUF5591 domain-containing protein [Euryarchaeota archaeon]
MLEIEKRCVLARSGRWEVGDHSIRLPAIAFVHTNRIQSPEFAELLLSDEKVDRDKLTLVDRGSVFSPSQNAGDVTIGLDFPVPVSLQDLDTESRRIEKTDAVVIHSGQEKLVDEADVYVAGNAIELIRHPREFVEEIVALRDSTGYGSLIYLPGLALPSNLALLCYCGADILDSTRVIWESRTGNILTPEGRLAQTDAQDPSCKCPACSTGKEFARVLEHNCHALQGEMERTAHHIKDGTLREYVEKRSVHDPWMIAVLRHFDLKHYEHQELHFPITGPGFHANTKESLYRPDILRFRKRIKDRYRRPESAKILLLLPCSAKKPYSLSKTHSAFRKAIKDSGNRHLIHEVIITSPLGIVPRELELFFPSQHYDIPVTGHWFEDEISIIQEDMVDYLEKNEYDKTIVHLGSEKDFVCEILDNYISTSDGSPTSAGNLSTLTKELSKAGSGYEKVPGSSKALEDMLARCIFQFGKGGQELVKSAEVKGRYPNLKIFSGDKQLGMLVGERGMISLTLEGAERISKKDSYCVEIDDFYPEGNLFAVGVEDADKEIRIADDVVVRHKGDVRAVGTAMMNWREMVESERGEAVRIRHKKKA